MTTKDDNQAGAVSSKAPDWKHVSDDRWAEWDDELFPDEQLLYDGEGRFQGDYNSLEALHIVSRSVLPRGVRLTLIALLLRCSPRPEGWCCWPSMKTLGLDVGISDRTVRRSVRKLERCRLVKVFPGGPRRPHTYRLNMERIYRLFLRTGARDWRDWMPRRPPTRPS